MQIIINRGMSPMERARLDNAEAAAVKDAANIDYISMMSDIEIPTEEENADE